MTSFDTLARRLYERKGHGSQLVPALLIPGWLTQMRGSKGGGSWVEAASPGRDGAKTQYDVAFTPPTRTPLYTLRDEPKMLRRDCRIVAKSRIPHTRRHLSTDVEFLSPEDLESRKRTFPASHPSSNFSACFLPYFCTHKFSTSFVPCPFSKA